MTLGIQDIVEVKAEIEPRGAGGREFGRTLLLTTDPTMGAGAGRVGVFASMDEVARVFTAGSVPYQAAQVYFSQVPYPRNLVIGRWINTRESARLIGGIPRALEQIIGSPTVVRGSGTVASLDTFHGRATVLTGAGMVAGLVNFHGRATVLTGAGMVADLVNFHGRATVLTGAGMVADLVNFHGRATVVTGTGTVADLVNFHGRATVLTGTGTVADLVNFHGRATVVTGTGTVASLTTLQGITSGTVTFLGQTLTGLDFSSDTDLDGVASTLQTALRATSATDLDNVEVDYDSTASAFVVTLPLDSSTGVVPTASAAFTGDDSDELGLDTATIVNGVDAIVSGTVTFLGQTVTGLDFSSVTDYDGVASVLQTALRATSATDLDNVEVAYDSAASAFVVTLPLDSSGVVPTASAAFTGDDADELGLDTATIVDGVDAIKSGTVTFLSQTVTGLDFSAVTDLDDVASVLQTALRATSATSLDEVEVAHDGSVFVVTLPLDSSGVVPTASAAFTGTESDELGLDTATIVNGVDAIVSGTVTFLGQTVTGLDFSSVTDYDGVASVLQTALRAISSTDLDNVEVDYDSAASVFVVTIPLATDGAATSVSAAFTGSESDELGLDTATIVDGVSAIQSGSVTLLGETFSGLDFSAVTDYDGVASVLQDALRAASVAALASVEVAYQGGVFVVIIPLDSQGAATSVSAAFTGDDADELGLDTATIVNGVDAIQSGTVTFLSRTLTGLDFSAVTDYDDVAAVLQTALRGATGTTLDTVEVTYDSGASAFVVTIPLAADGSATAVIAAFTGATADEVGLDTVTIEDGIDTITAGSVTFHGASLTGLDLSSVAGYDDVAAVVQNALRGSSVATLDAVEVEHDGSQFVLTLPLSLDGFATEVSGPFTGEHADELGLDTVDITAGVDGIGAGSLTWQGYTISGLDFTGAASYDDVANIVQTALRAVTASGRADLRSASVEYDPADFFRASLGFRTNGDPYPITGFKVDVAQGAASALGLDNASGGSIDPGHASEPIGDAMDAISGLDDGWYFVTVDSGITTGADLLSLSRWVQAKVHMLALDVVDEGVLTPNESTSLAAQLSALEQQKTFLVWSRTRDNKALSLAGRLSSVNFDGEDTLITPKFKSLPATTPDIVTTAHKEELDRKWVGYYTRFGPDAIFAEGWTQAGDWIDVRYWLDWIISAIQDEVYNLLRQHPTRVPQTAEGLASIEAAIERVCEAGRRNGGLAPGRVSEAVANDIRLAINNPDFDGFLTRGYLVVVGSIADQLEQDRNARKAPPARVWITGSGAMHSATIILTFAG